MKKAKKIIIPLCVIVIPIIAITAGFLIWWNVSAKTAYIIDSENSSAYFMQIDFSKDGEYIFVNKTDKRNEENGTYKISDEKIIFYTADNKECAIATLQKENKTFILTGTLGGVNYENQKFKQCSSLEELKKAINDNQQ